MAVKLGSLRRDIKKQNDGDWVPFSEYMDPKTGEIPEFLVRGFNYKPFQIARSNIIAKLTRRYGQKPIDPEESHREEGRIFAQHLLLGWRNAEPPYDRDVAEEMLCDISCGLQDMIRRCAIEVDQMEAQFTSDAAGNSVRSSGDSSKAKAAVAAA
jgi:hypothetical protein